MLNSCNFDDEDFCMKSRSANSTSQINCALWASSKSEDDEATSNYIAEKNEDLELNENSIQYYDTIHIRMNLEAAEMISIALK